MKTIEVNKTQVHLRKFLIENYALLKSKNSAFSVRSYARKLTISPAALSEMLNGKRKISSKTAAKILDRLNLSPEEREKLYKLSNSPQNFSAKSAQFVLVEMDQYHMISDWYYFAILSLFETEDFQDDPNWISQRLNIRITEAKTALERLERLGLVERNKFNKLTCTGASFKTSTNISNATIRKSHVDNLDLAKESLERDDVSIRDFSSMTMAIDPTLLPEAKKMILNFRRKLTQFLESETKNEVYKLNIQLFPLSTRKDNK